MKKLRMLFLLGGTLLLGVAPLAAQNSVVVLGGGPQPSNTTGCSSLPNCILASFDGSSNSHNGDITAPITANFYYAGGAQTPVTPSAAAGQSAWPIAVCSPGCSPPRSPTARQGAAPGTQSVLS